MEKNKSINHTNIKRITTYAVMLAIITALTYFVYIPMGTAGAYLNAGDVGIYIASYLLGGWGGAAVAATGSALADVLVGSAIYAPATFAIKGLMALIAGLMYVKLPGKARYACTFIAGLVMPTGYFFYELIIFDASAALFGLWTNAIQYGIGAVLGIIAVIAFERIPFIMELRDANVRVKVHDGLK